MKVSLAHVLICSCSFLFVNYFYYKSNTNFNYCIFLQPLAPICEVCGTAKPKIAKAKYTTWCCKFCTLDNSTKLDKCSACDQWRYSYGPPVATYGPSYDWHNIEISYSTVSTTHYHLKSFEIFLLILIYICLLVRVSCMWVEKPAIAYIGFVAVFFSEFILLVSF